MHTRKSDPQVGQSGGALTILDTVDFHGRELVVAPEEEAILFRPLCEAIGVQFAAQLKRLKRQPWGRVSMMDTPDARGHLQPQVAIPRKLIPMWLATLETNRVKDPEARRVIILFQEECVDVLDAYWNQRAAMRSDNLLERIKRQNRALEANRRLAAAAKRGEITREESLAMRRQNAYDAGIVETPELPAQPDPEEAPLPGSVPVHVVRAWPGLVHALAEVFGVSKPFRVGDVAKLYRHGQTLTPAVLDLRMQLQRTHAIRDAGVVLPMVLGTTVFRRMQGRVADGLTIVKSQRTNRGNTWTVAKVGEGE